MTKSVWTSGSDKAERLQILDLATLIGNINNLLF